MTAVKLAVLLAALGATAHAGPFLANEFDAREVGRGDTGAATDDAPSAIYYNVGGLAAGSGTRVQLTGALATSFATFEPAAGASSDASTSPQVLPALFASHRINCWLSAGIGFYTPFTSVIEWPGDAPSLDVVRRFALRTYFITPAAGVNLGRWVPGLTLGGGVDLVPATVQLERAIYFGTDRGSADFGETAFGVGGRAGAMYRPPQLPQLSVGVMWRSNVHLAFSGTADYDAPPPYRSTLPPDGPIATAQTLPQQWIGGAAVRPLAALELEANVVWTDWSVVRSLAVRNTLGVRAGAEYALDDVGVALRAGYLYDPSPVPSKSLTPLVPDANRHALTLGATKQLGAVDVSVGLLWTIPRARATAPGTSPEYPGTFDVSSYAAAVTVAGRIGS